MTHRKVSKARIGEVLRDLCVHNQEQRVGKASRILSEYLDQTAQTTDEAIRLACMETVCRVDVMDEMDAAFRTLWWSFRSQLGVIFRRETGLILPACCRFPRSNLYSAYRDCHRQAA